MPHNVKLEFWIVESIYWLIISCLLYTVVKLTNKNQYLYSILCSHSMNVRQITWSMLTAKIKCTFHIWPDYILQLFEAVVNKTHEYKELVILCHTWISLPIYWRWAGCIRGPRRWVSFVGPLLAHSAWWELWACLCSGAGNGLWIYPVAWQSTNQGLNF